MVDERASTPTRWALRLVALAYLAFLLIIPVGLIFWRTFQHGVGPVWDALTSSDALHAFQVTLIVAGTAVVFNTVFGLIASFLLVRHEFRGKAIINKLIDLPLAVSPVVVGLALILVYGRDTSVGSWLSGQGVDVIYALPGMIMATCFVSLPLVVRELVPVLEEIGEEQEQAAATLGASPTQTFRRITLPAIRWGLAYGVILTLARSLGEYGAVAVVSGRIVGQTQTATLYVEQSFENFQRQSAYAVSFALAFLAIVALLLMNVFRPKSDS
jgi:sulfate/thiosulfate transport system permease protein